MSQQNFYEKYAQLAIDQQIKYGIPASITLQQMALESGHGKSDLAANYNNYFGVKAGSSWKGPIVMKVDDHSYPEAFRVYGSVEESVENHSKVLMASRYRKCFNYSSTDYQNWAIQIRAAGYASDKTYVQKLIKLIGENQLYKYDQMALEQARQQGVEIGYMRNGKAPSTPASTPSKQLLNPLQGNWALPIDLAQVKVTGQFHESRTGHLHGGLDLSTQGKYFPVAATEDNGKVVAVQHNNGAAGNMVTVEYNRQDGTNIRATYMHLSQIDVKKGDIVNAGQQLGMSGNSGRSSGPHLHFETSVQNQNGEWEKFDPKNYLAEMEVRSGITTSLDRNGKDYLAEARNSMALNNQPSQQTNQQQDSNMALLASITNSNDPTEWLSYMMQQNGETPGNGQDIISSLISSLFSAALTLGLKMRSEEQAEAEELAFSKAAKVEETEENNVVKMSRSDVQKIQANASMMFDAESPEQGQQQSQRLA